MKKILVLSDSHRNVFNMCQAVSKENPDMIIHLGDCYEDAERLSSYFPSIPMEAVNGNCDYGWAPVEKMLLIENKKIFICHGHYYSVKNGYLALEYAAREKGADIVLFGHTHRLFYDYHNGLFIFNPGSIGLPHPPAGPSYGLLIIDNGEVSLQTRFLDPE